MYHLLKQLQNQQIFHKISTYLHLNLCAQDIRHLSHSALTGSVALAKCCAFKLRIELQMHGFLVHKGSTLHPHLINSATFVASGSVIHTSCQVSTVFVQLNISGVGIFYCDIKLVSQMLVWKILRLMCGTRANCAGGRFCISFTR